MDEDLYGATPGAFGGRESGLEAYDSDAVRSESQPFSLSDKENSANGANAPRGLPTELSSTSKRQRPAATQGSRKRRSRNSTQHTALSEMASQGYDPDQNIEERREVRKNLRDLARDLNDNRSEYLNPSSTGLLDILNKADGLQTAVKQTSDATIDSRLLLLTADLSHRKTVQLTLGTSAQGVDVDEFVSKCITFMRSSDAPPPVTNTQRQSRRDEEMGDDGDMLNWEHLGRAACLQYNSRPAVSGFLLGPLSLEKRQRKITQRKAPLRINNIQQTQPEVLAAGDIERSENSNLTVLCSRILSRLKDAQRSAREAVEAEATDDMSDAEMQALMDKYGIHDNGAMDLFKFVVNPDSFGQTVENMFYVSFLIRDGKAGINIDDTGIPSIEPTQPRKRSELSQQISKHQAVLALDYATWHELIRVFDIRTAMIPHRETEDHSQIGVRGWYG